MISLTIGSSAVVPEALNSLREASADFNASMLSSVYATSVLFTRASAAAITSSALCASVVFVIVKSSAYLFPL